jgi:hypothetical protein
MGDYSSFKFGVADHEFDSRRDLIFYILNQVFGEIASFCSVLPGPKRFEPLNFIFKADMDVLDRKLVFIARVGGSINCVTILVSYS